MDESGEHMSDYDHEVYKERLDPNGKPITKEVLRGIFRFMCKKKGCIAYSYFVHIFVELSNKAVKEGGAMLPVPENYCGPCYGANPDDKENQCCNTCDEVLRAYAGMGWHSSPDDYEQVKEKNTKSTTTYVLYYHDLVLA
jgi:hypothetical protein